MRHLSKAGFAVIVAVVAAVQPVAGDSARAAAADAPAQPDTRAATGGWTRDGWSDATPSPVVAAAPVSAAAPGWRDPEPPGGWRRQTWDGGRGPAYRYRRGTRLPDAFSAPAYLVRDWQFYRLPPPGAGRDWIRYYDDAVLVDRSGIVQDAVPAIGWDAVIAGYGARDDDHAPPRDPHYGEAWDSGECRPGVDGGYRPGTCTHHAADGSVTVTTTTAPVVTTHTTVVTRPVRTVKRKPVVVRKRAAHPAR